MEGVERYKVRLQPHNLLWDIEFRTVKKELEELLKDDIIDIQHVGSTAIPLICAKPILDIAIKVKSIKLLNIENLKLAGYDYCGMQHGNENYHLFVLRGENQVSLRHIHYYEKNEKEFDLLVGFRNYLNSNDDMAMEYERIKMELAEKYPEDRISYTNGKEAFIQSIYKAL